MRYKLIAMLLLWASSIWCTDPAIRVLSLDGGGVKGIIEAVVLTELERELNKPISQIFDLIAGSSVGGIIALGLSVPGSTGEPLYRAYDILDVFLNHNDKVFHASLFHRLHTLGGLLGPKYHSESFRNLLNQYLGSTMLSEAIIPILITGYHVDGEVGVEFFSEEARAYPENVDCTMREIGLATAAAPTYFNTPNVQLASISMHAIADGGLYKNNPALLAYVNALKLYPGRKIEVFSLGTGKVYTEELGKDLTKRGMISWLPPIFYHAQASDTEGENVILHRLLNENGEENYFRLDIRLDREHRKMDNISKKNIRYLYKKGQEIIKTDTYNKILSRLKNNY